MKAFVAILSVAMCGAALADTAKPVTADKPYIYDSNRIQYRDDRAPRLCPNQGEVPPACQEAKKPSPEKPHGAS
jgi:hypothetical protein